MVKKAQARADAFGLDAAVRVMDVHALDFPEAHFDAALLHLVLAVVPDPEAAIHEVARVLKPSGRVGVFDKFLSNASEPSPLRRATSAVANVVATDLNRRLGPLLDVADLTLEHEESVFFGGFFKVATARKPASDAA